MYSIHSVSATGIWELVSSTELSCVQGNLATSSGHRGLLKCVNAVNGGRSSSSNTRIIRNVPEGHEGKSLLIFKYGQGPIRDAFTENNFSTP